MAPLGTGADCTERLDDVGFQGSELWFGGLSFDGLDMQQWGLVHFIYHSHGLRVESGITGEYMELDLPLPVLHDLHSERGDPSPLSEYDIFRNRG